MSGGPPPLTIASDANRLHLRHGPIELIIGVDGDRQTVATAFDAATARFGTILDELVGELRLLRSPISGGDLPNGAVAKRMVAAVAPFREVFVTPMAAVAGSVADEILDAMLAGASPRRAFVNNGGDIAIHLAPGESPLRIGMVSDVATCEVIGQVPLDADSHVRGIATSGRGGRSQTLGIADAVTVMSSSAAIADAVATLVANEVDLPGHQAIVRRPAIEVRDGSDLGTLPVCVRVGALSQEEVVTALRRGASRAIQMIDEGVAHGVTLTLRGNTVSLGSPPLESSSGLELLEV